MAKKGGKKGGGKKNQTGDKQEAKARKLLAKQQAKLQERHFEFERQMVYSRANLSNIQSRLERLAHNKYFNFIHGGAMQEWKLFTWSARAKDKMISALISELHNYQERRRIAEHMHLEIFDEILRLYDEQVKRLNKTYIRTRDKYVRERFHYMRGLSLRTQKQLNEIVSYGYDMRLRYRDEQKSLTTDLMIRQASYESKESIRKVELETIMEDKILILWKEYQNVMKNYKEETYGHRSAMTIMNDREVNCKNIIASYTKRVARLSAFIQVFKENYPGTKLKRTADYLVVERVRHRKYYEQVRDTIGRLYEEDQQKLSTLSEFSNGAINPLKEAFNKIEVLFKYMHLSCRFETEEEKTCVPEEMDQNIPDEPENATLKLMRKLYYRRAQVKVQISFLQAKYKEATILTVKLKKLIEYVIHSFDIGAPEVLQEDTTVLENLYNI